MRDDFDAKWHEVAEEVLSGMKGWRLQHPRATLREIEQTLDARLGKMRARLLEDSALASEVAENKGGGAGERAVCAQCGVVLEGRGKQVRRLTTHYEQVLRLERSYGVCPACGEGFFPPG